MFLIIKFFLKCTILRENAFFKFFKFLTVVNTISHFTGQSLQVEFLFECNLTAHEPLITFNGKESLTYTFKVQTILVCLPQPVKCQLTNAQNEVFDLSPLADKPYWVTTDTRQEHSDLKYYLSVCKPLGKVPFYANCSGMTKKILYIIPQQVYNLKSH